MSSTPTRPSSGQDRGRARRPCPGGSGRIPPQRPHRHTSSTTTSRASSQGTSGVDPQTGTSILSEILFYAPNTLELVLASMVVIIVASEWGSGYISGMRFGTKTRLGDQDVLSLNLVDPLLPREPWSLCWSSPATSPSSLRGERDRRVSAYNSITGIFVLDALLQANWPAFAVGTLPPHSCRPRPSPCSASASSLES